MQHRHKYMGEAEHIQICVFANEAGGMAFSWCSYDQSDFEVLYFISLVINRAKKNFVEKDFAFGESFCGRS